MPACPGTSSNQLASPETDVSVFLTTGHVPLPPAVPSFISAHPDDQEDHQQGQHRVPAETGEEQHRREEEPGQGPQTHPDDPAEGCTAAGGEPEAADAHRTAHAGAGHSQTRPVTAPPAGSG